ncbi:MAG TPA: hypothetical protein VLT58_11660 [Polyangia bacterium]|nr:hypothetical protein [Polyangia bacterium]
MLTRALAILIAPCLPLAALIFPFSTAPRVSALLAGALATVLSAFAFSSDRARFGAAAVGAYAALTALVFPSSLLEQVIVLSWGTSMLAWLAGPLSTPPVVTRTAAAVPAPQAHGDEHLPMAA